MSPVYQQTAGSSCDLDALHMSCMHAHVFGAYALCLLKHELRDNDTLILFDWCRLVSVQSGSGSW